jgi:sec-independent protein translocase protein TatB
MFDIGASELLLIVIVAIVVIGPKDLPMALRTAGRWIAKVRRVSGHFRSGIETMIREAELEEMEKKWREQNAAIMAATSDPAHFADPAQPAAARLAPPAPASAGESSEEAKAAAHAEPQLPLPPP